MEISDRDGRNATTPALMFTDSRKMIFMVEE